MLWWVVDNAWMLYFLVGAVAVALGLVWWANRDWRTFAAFAGSVLVLLVIYLLSAFIVTDRGQLRGNVVEMAAGIENRRPGDIAKHLSRQFRYGGVTKANAEQKIDNAIRHYRLRQVYATDIAVEAVDRAKNHARVWFLARVDFGSEGVQMFRCRTDWVREDARWRMKAFDLFNPVVDADTPLQVPLP